MIEDVPVADAAPRRSPALRMTILACAIALGGSAIVLARRYTRPPPPEQFSQITSGWRRRSSFQMR